MNQKKAKAIRKQLRADGVEITSKNGRKAYRSAKNVAAVRPAQFVKPLPEPHSKRTVEARAHAALPTDERNKPWRVGAPLISAKHPQRERRPGSKRHHTAPDFADPMLRFQAFGSFARSFLAGMATAAAMVGLRYQKRAARGR